MDEREIEAVAYVLHEAPPEADLANVARECIAAVDRVRDARGDDEAARLEGRTIEEWADLAGRLADSDPAYLTRWQIAIRERDEARAELAARSPQGEDHEALRAAAKRVLEADMRGVRDLDALNALEDAAGFSQQGQDRRRAARSPQGEGHEAGIPEAALDAAEAAVHASRRYALGHPSRKAIYVEARDEAYDVLTAAMPHLSRVSPSRDARGDDEPGLTFIYGHLPPAPSRDGTVAVEGPCPTCGDRGWHTAGGNDPMACGRCAAGEAWSEGTDSDGTVAVEEERHHFNCQVGMAGKRDECNCMPERWVRVTGPAEFSRSSSGRPEQPSPDDKAAPGRDGDKLYCLCDHNRTYCPHTEGLCPWWYREPVDVRWTAVQPSPDARGGLPPSQPKEDER